LKTTRWTSAALLLCGLYGTATAADEPRTWLRLHATGATWDVNSSSGVNFFNNPPSSALEDSTLGLPQRKAIPGLGFGRRIGQRWRIELDYTTARRRGSALLAGDLQVEGIRYLAGTRIESDQTLATLRINGGWSFYQDPQLEAGLLIGGQWLRLSQRLSGTATFNTFVPPNPNPVPSAPTPLRTVSKDTAPVWSLGAWGSWAPADAWRLNARAEVGPVRELSVAAQWWWNRHLALGAGYRAIQGKVDERFCFISCGGQLKLDYRIHGPTLSVDLAF
jgi:hypothetical protein